MKRLAILSLVLSAYLTSAEEEKVTPADRFKK
jgi:hypothetical protein